MGLRGAAGDGGLGGWGEGAARTSTRPMVTLIEGRAGIWESSATRLDNWKSVPASKTALKENDWNRAVVQLKGNQMTMIVNERQVLSLPIAEQANREFGFFHFTDHTEVKVRDIKLSLDD